MDETSNANEHKMVKNPGLFMAVHYHFSGCKVFPNFWVFTFLRYFFTVTCYLALSISLLLLFIFYLFTGHIVFPIFKICNVLI